VSRQEDTSKLGETKRAKRRRSGFRFPEGEETMEDFVAYFQLKLEQLPFNPVLVAGVERRSAQINQAKKALL
jgi:hypothetical protein